MTQFTYAVTIDFLNKGVNEEAEILLDADDFESAQKEALQLCIDANGIFNRKKSDLSFFGLKSVELIDDTRWIPYRREVDE